MKVVLRSSSLLFFLVNLFFGLGVKRRPVARKNVGSSPSLASPASSREDGDEPSLDVGKIA
jgi:hypothetical protein